MLRHLMLLIPAIIPSWRFFDEIAPSPRIEYALLTHAQDTPKQWHEFRPRPSTISVGGMVRRLFWNASWNESLFLVSCAERLLENPTDHSHNEIVKRIYTDLQHNGLTTPFLQFQLLLITRQGAELNREITYRSAVQAYEGMAS